MRRACALLLLLVFSLPLIPAALYAESDSKLPACCRRDGKHGCSMKSMKPESANAGAGGIDHPLARKTCPVYPAGSFSPAQDMLVLVAPASLSPAALPSQANRVEQAEARYRVSFSRSRQKRGPPLS